MANIKNLKPNKKSRYKQGYFNGAKKYFGPEPIIYRSSLEYRFMVNLELNSKVEKWSSEEIVVPYKMKERVKGRFVEKRHNYHTDFSVIMKDGTKFLIEIKPSTLTPLNESQIKRNPAMYKNACKWKAAIKWSKLNNYKFRVITEKNLNI